MNCPDCNNHLKHEEKMGLYCGSCGLIIGTYTEIKREVRAKKQIRIKERAKLLKQLRKRCSACGKENVYNDGIEITLHHIIPRRAGGKELIVGLCRTPCHNIADIIVESLYPNQVDVIEKKSKQ
ncbi:MAG: hypothetical protein AABY10_02775 [Nanoarchaeota archaeon]